VECHFAAERYAGELPVPVELEEEAG
jgi:hypothetical protein